MLYWSNLLKKDERDQSKHLVKFLESLGAKRIKVGDAVLNTESYMDMDGSKDHVYYLENYREHIRVIFRVSTMLSGVNKNHIFCFGFEIDFYNKF